MMEVRVPEKKRVRMIVDTDCKNEADDPFALVHHLLMPMFDITTNKMEGENHSEAF